MRTALGIDLGGTQIKAVVAAENGEILRRELRPVSYTHLTLPTIYSV